MFVAFMLNFLLPCSFWFSMILAVINTSRLNIAELNLNQYVRLSFCSTSHRSPYVYCSVESTMVNLLINWWLILQFMYISLSSGRGKKIRSAPTLVPLMVPVHSMVAVSFGVQMQYIYIYIYVWTFIFSLIFLFLPGILYWVIHYLHCE